MNDITTQIVPLSIQDLQTRLDGTSNAQALIRLAERLEFVFQLPMRHAPGFAFVGAIAAPVAYGIRGHGDVAQGVGGRGTSLRQAFESCMGEAAEYYALIEWDDDPRVEVVCDAALLGPEERDWCLLGLGVQPCDNPKISKWVTARSLLGDRRVGFPAELVLRCPQSRASFPRQAESNGLGAGPTFKHALLSGLLEVVERDAVALWWFGGRAAHSLDARVEKSVSFRTFLQRGKRSLDRPVWFLDVSSEIDIPVVGAFSSTVDGNAVVSGFAANPDLETAAKSAFLEMCQMELAQEISLNKRDRGDAIELTRQDRIWIDRYDNLSVENYPRLRRSNPGQRSTDASSGNPFESAIGALDRAGFSPYGVDLTRAGIDVLVARVLVPGMQSAKPDWPTRRLREVAHRNGINLDYALKALSPI